MSNFPKALEVARGTQGTSWQQQQYHHSGSITSLEGINTMLSVGNFVGSQHNRDTQHGQQTQPPSQMHLRSQPQERLHQQPQAQQQELRNQADKAQHPLPAFQQHLPLHEAYESSNKQLPSQPRHQTLLEVIPRFPETPEVKLVADK